MKQYVGSYEIDSVTRDEASADLKAALGHHFDATVREHYRGVKVFKLPVLSGVAAGATFTLPVSVAGPLTVCGPEQGFFWRIQRVLVASSGVDVGAVSLFAGSDPTNTSTQFLVDNTLVIGKAYYPGTKGLVLWPGEQLYASMASVASNTYRLMGLAVEVPAEMQAKLMAE